MGRLALVAALLVSSLGRAEPPRDRFGAGGYLRIMTRPDFEGGTSKLGYWNLYGRLLNEGPWGALELRLDVLQAPPQSHDVWASVHAKIEGGSFANADPGMGRFGNFGITQLYVKAGNLILNRVTWQVGTLEYYFGDLGLYDLRPAQLFNDTVGVSARYQGERVDLLVGAGDSGHAVRGERYNTLLTAGAAARLRLSRHFEVGAGAQLAHEPTVPGSRLAPYDTPGVRYEDYLRREVARRFLEEHPGQEDLFPDPVATAAQSHRVVGYLGFGQLGPLRWNNLFVSWKRVHPDGPYVETYQGRDYVVYATGLTDERYQLLVGNELQLRLVPDRLDLAWSLLYGRDENRDNPADLRAPGEDNREYYSTVLRAQLYLTKTVHVLVESSLAREKSLDGNLYRTHADSIFRSTSGRADSRGLELGDSDVRDTWQLKTGLVLNPTGLGIYARPSLRLLYGLQYSSQQAAFGNGFVESLDQYNVFPSPERHWHSVVAVEAEAWF